jgi:Eukaryotic aspartyl protease
MQPTPCTLEAWISQTPNLALAIYHPRQVGLPPKLARCQELEPDCYVEGILGIGYMSNEVQVSRNGKQAYPNVPQLLVNQKLIQSNAYSLWLDDLEASTGLILFGGVNTEKYHGSLSSEFIIAMTGPIFSSGDNNQTITSGSTIPVLLDSGSSLSYLPDDTASALFSLFGARYDTKSQAAYVPCSMANNPGTLDFVFTEPTISVPLSELVIDPGPRSDGSRLTFQDGTDACIFGISNSGDSTNVLGDTFLRSAYVVYDLDNNEVSLAQTNFNSTKDNIKEITSGSNSVPDATGVSGVANAVPTQTGGGRLGSPTQTGGTIPGGNSKGQAASLQVPPSMIVFFIGILSSFVLYS